MAAYEHLVKACDIGDLLDEIASARVLDRERPEDPDAAAELGQLTSRVAGP